MSELENWKQNRTNIGFNEWEILNGLIIVDADWEGFLAEGNIDGKFCKFLVSYDGDFDGVQYNNTIELIKESDKIVR